MINSVYFVKVEVDYPANERSCVTEEFLRKVGGAILKSGKLNGIRIIEAIIPRREDKALALVGHAAQRAVEGTTMTLHFG